MGVLGGGTGTLGSREAGGRAAQSSLHTPPGAGPRTQDPPYVGPQASRRR